MYNVFKQYLNFVYLLVNITRSDIYSGSNISKRENIKLWRNIFPNCAPVSHGEQRIVIK
jgi:hypothetical protein